MGKNKKHPCVDVCRYAGPKGWCVACGLTSRESRTWRKLKPYDKNILLKKLQRRKAALKTLRLSDDAE